MLVVTCDLITDVDLAAVLNLFLQHGAALSTLFFLPVAPLVPLPTPGPKSKDKTGECEQLIQLILRTLGNRFPINELR